MKHKYQTKFSPRPWGWTAYGPPTVDPDNVFPPPVGMDRKAHKMRFSKFGFPHARGDGPKVNEIAPIDGKFSPRPWGWTVGLCELGRLFHRFPHARGDGQHWLPVCTGITGRMGMTEENGDNGTARLSFWEGRAVNCISGL